MFKNEPAVAKWLADGLFYPGKITKMVRKDAYSIEFLDGDKSTVTAKNIFRLNLKDEEERIAGYKRHEEQLNDQHERQIEKLIDQHETQIEKLIAQHERHEEQLVDQHERQIEKLISQHARQVARDQKVRELRDIIEERDKEIKSLNTWLQKFREREEKEFRERRQSFANVEKTMVVPGD